MASFGQRGVELQPERVDIDVETFAPGFRLERPYTPVSGKTSSRQRMERVMSSLRDLIASAAGAVVVVCSGSCSATVDSSTGGGPESPPKAFCSAIYGTMRSSMDPDGFKPPACAEGQICASDGENDFCCDPTQDAQCPSYGATGSTENGVYCGPGGWERLPMTVAGQICKSNEFCARHKTTDCNFICCDPRQDPDCGVALKSCCSQCG
jgi:hypothetical protein